MKRFLKRAIGYITFIPYKVKWHLFRRKMFDSATVLSTQFTNDERGSIIEKENKIIEIISKFCSNSFLEIGIGGAPEIPRLRLIKSKSVAYTGCDFKVVCDRHMEIIKQNGINTDKIRFVSNTSGTYSWNLFQMMKSGEQFDFIYIDGHHTFNVDLPAFIIADQLLTKGGYMLVDDIDITLEFIKLDMARFLGEWYLYRNTYSFTEYTPEQQKAPHIQMIVEEFMMEKLGYTKIEDYCPGGRWLLKKN